MDKLDMELIKKIEQILSLEFREWQINYMLDIPMVLDMNITRRRTGKTLVYVLKLLFSDDDPIYTYTLKQMRSISDSDNYSEIDDNYTKWFKSYLIEIYEQLTNAGIVTRPVLYSGNEKIDKKEYFRF